MFTNLLNLQMVDFGKESIDVDDEDAVDRIIQCSQAASPFFSVIINSQSQLKINWLLKYLDRPDKPLIIIIYVFVATS